MLKNFHEIKAIISNTRGFKATFYGMSEYVHGMMINRFKFKNPSVKVITYFKKKLSENSFKIENNKVYTSLISILKPNENIINFKNEIVCKVLSAIKPNNNKITFLNKAVQKFNILFDSKIKENTFTVENDNTKIQVALNTKVDENDVYVDNDNVQGTNVDVALNGKVDNNDVYIENNEVNGAAYFFIKLEAMAGDLNAYYNQTIEDTGRKKNV